jgi:hypothetical protein
LTHLEIYVVIKVLIETQLETILKIVMVEQSKKKKKTANRKKTNILEIYSK